MLTVRTLRLARFVLLFFFFSSRRRHTRWTGDWSSDVCSSDLRVRPLWEGCRVTYARRRQVGAAGGALGAGLITALCALALGGSLPADIAHHAAAPRRAEGRTVVRNVVVRRRQPRAPGAPPRPGAAAGPPPP